MGMIIHQKNGKRIYKDALALLGVTEEEFARTYLGIPGGAISLRNSSARDRYREALIRIVSRTSIDAPWDVCTHCGFANHHDELPPTEQVAGKDNCLNCHLQIGF